MDPNLFELRIWRLGMVTIFALATVVEGQAAVGAWVLSLWLVFEGMSGTV